MEFDLTHSWSGSLPLVVELASSSEKGFFLCISFILNLIIWASDVNRAAYAAPCGRDAQSRVLFW